MEGSRINICLRLLHVKWGGGPAEASADRVSSSAEHWPGCARLSYGSARHGFESADEGSSPPLFPFLEHRRDEGPLDGTSLLGGPALPRDRTAEATGSCRSAPPGTGWSCGSPGDGGAESAGARCTRRSRPGSTAPLRGARAQLHAS